jgi:DNA modification methylase
MSQARFQLTKGDAVAWLRTLPAASVDLVITDPPYESLEKHRAVGTTTRLKHSKASSNDWFSIFPNARFPELFAEVYRVLKKDSHFYLYCDPETMFVAKPLAEQAGFKFWKPLIWDKCLGPDTLVWTERGAQRIADVAVGDRIALPEGGTSRVRATRRTQAPSLRLSLSDGTELLASRDHRFMRADGAVVEAAALSAGDKLCTRPVRERVTASLRLDDPAHPVIDLDRALGTVIGLYAAYGSSCEHGVRFTLRDGAALADIVAVVEPLGMRAHVRNEDSSTVVELGYKLLKSIVDHFVGGARAEDVYFKRALYTAPAEFREGVLAGLGAHRELWTTPSCDVAMFARREHAAALCDRRAGAWSVHGAPRDGAAGDAARDAALDAARETTFVVTIEDVGMQDLVDISIEHPDELFLLANGVVTHNCTIGMGYHYRARYECVLFFEKGKRKLHDLGIADIIEAKRITGGYPAEKPPEVSEVLIKQSCDPGTLVIDPFMGSGSVGVAAIRSGRDFRGNDLCTEAVEITAARLREAGGAEAQPLARDPGAPQLGLTL